MCVSACFYVKFLPNYKPTFGVVNKTKNCDPKSKDKKHCISFLQPSTVNITCCFSSPLSHLLLLLPYHLTHFQNVHISLFA